MKRDYVVRGNRKQIEELDDIVAVKLEGEGAARTATLNGIGERYTAADSPEKSQWDAFEQGGWTFVRPTPATRNSIGAQTAINGVEAAARVFQHPKGRIYLGVDRLSVRLRDDMTDAQARNSARQPPPDLAWYDGSILLRTCTMSLSKRAMTSWRHPSN